MSIKKLNPKHQQFIKEYINCGGNAVQAYMKVYPKAQYETAKVNASKLLTITNLIQAIDDEYKKIWPEKDTDIEKSKTYQMIYLLGNSNIADIIDIKNGRLRVKDFKDIPSSALQAIQSIECDERETPNGIHRSIKIKMYSKIQSLELRAKIQRLIDNKIEAPIEIEIKRAVRPIKEDE
jgi:hypothetical protein